MWVNVCGNYEVSAEGHIRNRNTGRILKEFVGKDGYLRVQFAGKTRTVHRVVATAYVPADVGKDFVNHKDGNKQNNHVDNLEWVTMAENNIYGNHIKNSRRYVAVEQLTIDGQFIQRFNSIIDASEATGCRTHSIQSCCAGRYKSSCGYRWRYAE